MSGTTNNGNNYIIPRWFIVSATAVIGVAVPWGMWVTVQLKVMEQDINTISNLHSSYNIHVSDPELHYSRKKEVDSQFRSIESRLNRIEKIK